jgi:ABC-type branched-subunit amino acid transport system permease subunit/ABC-type branched-subunit amino acid transport system ATPase component
MLGTLANILAFDITAQYIYRGVVEGMAYALVAVGLVLVYRASGVVNFAQGQMGAFGALLMATLNYNYGVPYWLGIPLAIAAGAALGGLTELLVVRRLFHQPRLLLFVATLGVAQVIQLLMFRLPEIKDSIQYPSPIEGLWEVGPVTVRGDQLMVLITVPIITVLLAVLLTRTRFGQSVRASADNPNAASLSGISVKRVSTQVWVLAGGISAISAVLYGPLTAVKPGAEGDTLGPPLLLRALAAAMVGRLTSFPLAMAGGIAIGIIEVLIKLNTTSSGVDTLFIFAVLMALVLWRGASMRDEGGWTLAGKARTASAELARLPFARWVSRVAVGLLFAAAFFVPYLVTTQTRRNDYVVVLIFMMVALSATVLTGWAGQLSLAQFAFVGIGSYATVYYSESLAYPLAVGLGTLWGVAIALLIGIPALRLKGLNLAIITLGFQLTCSYWLFTQQKINNGVGGSQASLRNAEVGSWDLLRDKGAYYYITLAALVLVLFIVTRVRRSGIGRSLLAVRENESSAAAFTVSPMRAKLTAFALSGGIAAFAGGLYAASTRSITPPYFSPELSLRIVSISVVGGIVSITGAVLGTIVVEGLPVIFEGNDEVRIFASGVGMLILLMYFPGGLISIVHNIRDLFYGWLARRTGIKPKPMKVRPAVSSLSSRGAAPPTDVLPLRTSDVTVKFGGKIATDGVSIVVHPGEIVGLIGTNGAGKTTFMNAVSGFLPSSGHVELFGERVDRRSAHGRARLGMGRAFQNAKLFGALTVRETIMTALEARSRSWLLPSMFYLPPSPMQEARKRREADELIGYLGLGRYADTSVNELSTGTRRIVELASLIALDSKLMLLDEPTAGVAQKETEAFAPLITSIQRELGSSVLIIEHDMPLVMSISHRIYCLEAGAVIAEGAPAQVRADPLVIASYLGTDERAIQRSDATAAASAAASTAADV